ICRWSPRDRFAAPSPRGRAIGPALFDDDRRTDAPPVLPFQAPLDLDQPRAKGCGVVEPLGTLGAVGTTELQHVLFDVVVVARLELEDRRAAFEQPDHRYVSVARTSVWNCQESSRTPVSCDSVRFRAIALAVVAWRRGRESEADFDGEIVELRLQPREWFFEKGEGVSTLGQRVGQLGSAALETRETLLEFDRLRKMRHARLSSDGIGISDGGTSTRQRRDDSKA